MTESESCPGERANLTAEAQSAQRTTEKLLDSCTRRMNPQKTAMSLFFDMKQKIQTD
jgi:hypothetical protein